MTKTKVIENGVVEKKQFIIDANFTDPLVPLTAKNAEAFDDIEVEEANYYYNIFLGVPIHHES